MRTFITTGYLVDYMVSTINSHPTKWETAVFAVNAGDKAPLR